jgi:hypothetical protein
MTFGIALPPVLNEASQSVKDEVCRDVITSVTHFCATARCIAVAIASCSFTALRRAAL